MGCPTTIAIPCALWLACCAAAQTPSLLRDVNALPPPEPSSWPSDFVTFGGAVWFAAGTVLEGRELHRSDGTAPGTTRVADIAPGPADARLGGLTVAGGALWFQADDGVHGAEPWISDGTAAGTRMLADLAPGPAGSAAGGFCALGGRVFFRAVDARGVELWSTDGTAAGTQPFVDVRPGPDSAQPESLTAVGARLLFVADDGVHGREPWVTDGTAAGTTLLRDLYAGPIGSEPAVLAPLGGRLLLRVANGADVLWTTDGTAAGTLPIRCAATGVRATTATLGSTLLFAGYDPQFGEELWRTDGTAAGTARVADLHPGGASSTIRLLGVAGGRALLTVDFYGSDGLWVTDGTAAGTTRIAAIDVSSWTGVALGGAVLFAARDSSIGDELWRSDGTPAGTRLVVDAVPGVGGSFPGAFCRFGAQVVYAARDALGGEPWITDGTAAGTHVLANVGANPPGWTGGSAPGDSVDWNGTLAFVATVAEEEPWLSDGTRAGTRLHHRYPGTRPFALLNEDGNPRLHVDRGRLVSLLGNGPSWELWIDDGRGPAFASTIVLNGSSHPLGRWTTAGGALWFASDDLWRIDDGVAQRVRATAGQPVWGIELARQGHALVICGHDGTSEGVFRCDGTTITPLVRLAGGSASMPTAVEDRLFFVAQEPATGAEPWVSDGTPGGTAPIDLVPGPQGSQPIVVGAWADALLFFADDAVHGWELWATRGTVGGTVRLTDLPDVAPPWDCDARRVGLDRFVFVLDTAALGRELWTLTPAGARVVADLEPGPGGAAPRILGVAGDEVWFVADRPTAGLWLTDGTPAGTRLVMAGAQDARWFDVAGGQVFFDHDDPALGREPWTARAGATTERHGVPCGVGFRAPWLDANDPVLGRALVLRGGGAAPGAAGLVVVGAPTAAPQRLAGGCTFHVDPPTAVVLATIADAGRRFERAVALPRAPALVGRQLAVQLVTGPSTNPSGLALSNALRLGLDTW